VRPRSSSGDAGASTRQSGAASDPEGSQIGLQDELTIGALSPSAENAAQTLGAGDAGSRSGVRGTREVGLPAKVAHPLAYSVTVDAARSPAAAATHPCVDGLKQLRMSTSR
jgi:hypothetical protein